jgi:hypothetical protein
MAKYSVGMEAGYLEPRHISNKFTNWFLIANFQIIKMTSA